MKNTIKALGTLAPMACALLLSGAEASAEGDWRNPPILPVNENAYGASYSEWSARWAEWLLSIPEATNPQFDTTGANCGQKQSGPVWYLAGLFSPGSVIRNCTVPAGKALFVPIFSGTFGSATFDCKPTEPTVTCNIADLRILAAGAVEPATVSASIDARPVGDLRRQRVQSRVETITTPAGAVFGIPSATFTPNVSDGYWLLISPLSIGRHTIRFRAQVSGGPFPGNFEVTYNLTVRP